MVADMLFMMGKRDDDMNFSVMHDVCTQVIYKENGYSAGFVGIQLPNGDVISAGSGDIFKANEVEVISTYSDWHDLTDEIVGIGDWR